MILTWVWIVVTFIGLFYKTWNAQDAYRDWRWTQKLASDKFLVVRFAKDSFIASTIRATVVGLFAASGIIALLLPSPAPPFPARYIVRTIVMTIAVVLLAINGYMSRRERKRFIGY